MTFMHQWKQNKQVHNIYVRLAMVVISILYLDKLKPSRKNGNDISFLLKIVKIDKKVSFHSINFMIEAI